MSVTISVLHDVSVDTTKTKAFKLPDNVSGMAVFIPAKGNGAVTVEVYTLEDTSLDANSSVLAASTDTNWAVLDTAAAGTDLTVANSGVEGSWIGLTGVSLEAVRGVAGKWARLVDGAAQGSDVTYYINFQT